MSFMSKAGVPPTPTLPTGVQIASFATYLEAQRAVDLLSDKEFKVQHTTIVGTDLRMVERITGRLSYPRVALAGAISGAWFGLFVGLLFGLLAEGSIVLMLLPALLIGAAFGMMFGLVSYAFTGGKRDFTSSSQVVAGSYALLCDQSVMGEARRLLEEAGIRTRVGAPAPSAAHGPAGAGQGHGGAAQQPVPYGQAGAYGRPGPAAEAPGSQTGPAGPPGTGAGGSGGRPDGQPPAGSGAAGDQPPSDPARAPFTPWQDEHGNPRYGQRLPQPPPEQPSDGEPR